MNKKLLLSLLKRNKGRLQELRTKFKKNEVREEDLEAVEEEIDTLAEEILDLTELVEELEEEVEVIEEDLTDEERAKRKKRAGRAKKSKRAKRKKRDGAEDETLEDLQEEISELVEEVEGLVEAVTDIEDEVDVIEEDLTDEERAKRKKRLSRAKRAKRKKRDGAESETIEDLQDEIAELADVVADLVDDVDVVEDDIGDIEDEIVDEARGKRRGRNTASPQQRSASAAIRKGLSSRNAKSTKKRDSEVRSAFANYVVGKISEQEARSLGVDTGNGSVTIPSVIAAEIITYSQEENLLRKYGTAHRTTTNMQFPVLVKKAKANVSKKERTKNMPETEIEFDEIMLTPVEFDALATVTKKLIRMSGVNIEDVVVDELKKAYVEKETSYMFNGDDVGNENPGALAKKSVTYHESTPIDLDVDGWSQKLYSQLVKFKGQPVTAVLRKSIWIVNRAALTVLEDMTDANGRPLLHEATDGLGYKFLGHTLDFTDSADGADRTAPVFYFGDFSAFHIQDVEGELGIQRLIESYAAQNKIGFQIYNLLDGQLIYSPLEPAVYRYEIGTTA